MTILGNEKEETWRATTGTASSQTTVENASNNLEFDISASLPSATGSCRNNWNDQLDLFTGQWKASVCVDGQLVLSDESSNSAPAPSCN
jgi:hypothetical protein